MKSTRIYTFVMATSLLFTGALFAQDIAKDIDDILNSDTIAASKDSIAVDLQATDDEALDISDVADVEESIEVVEEEAAPAVVEEKTEDKIAAILNNEEENAPEEVEIKEKPEEVVNASPETVVDPSISDILDDNEEILISMTYDDTPLAEVVKVFRDASGANIIMSQDLATNLSRIISINLVDVPWKQGLSSVLSQSGLVLQEEPRGSGIYTIKEKTSFVQKLTKTYELKYSNASQLATLLKGVLGKDVVVFADTSANAIVVNAPEDQLTECADIIKSLDKPARQVYIEARFATLTAQAKKELGVRWDTLSKDQNGISIADDLTLSSEFLFGRERIKHNNYEDHSENRQSTRKKSFDNVFSGQIGIKGLDIALDAFENLDGANIFSNPKLIVANGKTAKIDMTTKYPYVKVESTQPTTDGGSVEVSTELDLIPKEDKETIQPWVDGAFFSYGISVFVTPQISPTGEITVNIQPAISDKTSEIDFTQNKGTDDEIPGSKFPIVEIKTLDTTFTMGDGKTAIIGGLTKSKEQNIDSGIPLLRHIPWIGPRLFGWKSRERIQEEIIIFVTVGIVDPINIPEDSGMPKNAIFGKELFSGKIKEPGDRTRAEFMDISK